MRALILALTLCLAAGPALAQSSASPTRPSAPKPAASKPREEPTSVSPVLVMPPTAKPKVVSTWPAAGQAIAPGVLVLKVVFDQEMTPRDFAYAPAAGGDALECLKTPRLLNDAKTFVLLCRTLPGKTYAVSLNKDRASPTAFANLAENRAVESELSFSTLTGEPVTKLREAIKAAGLADIDMPIEEAPRQASGAP